VATNLCFFPSFTFVSYAFAQPWPSPKAPVIEEADGYVEIPRAAFVPENSRVYRAVFDSTVPGALPKDLIVALNMAVNTLRQVILTHQRSRQMSL